MFSFFFFRESGWSIIHPQTPSPKASKSAIPKTWDDAEMAALEIPLANPIGSPKQVPADYYYRIPVRPIYKSYPVYAAGHEPTGYLESLKHKDPIIYWDDKGHAPTLETEADWINAGEAVFDAPIGDGGIGGSEPTDLYVRDPKFLEMTGALVAERWHAAVLPLRGEEKRRGRDWGPGVWDVPHPGYARRKCFEGRAGKFPL